MDTPTPPIARPPPARLASISSMLPLSLSSKRAALSAKVSRIVAHSQNSERRDWETPVGMITTPPISKASGARPQGRQVHWDKRDSPNTSPMGSPNGEATSPGVARKWAFGGYFGARAGNVPNLDESGVEKVLCFPGYATLRPSPHSEPSLVLEVTTSGAAYRLRPISQAPSAQRILYSVVKSFAALPKLPMSQAPGTATPETIAETSHSPSLGALLGRPGNEADVSKGALFEALLRSGQQSDEPEEMDESELPLVDLAPPIFVETEPSLNTNPPHLSRRPAILSRSSHSDPTPRRYDSAPLPTHPHSMISSPLNPSGSTSPRNSSSRSSSPSRLPSTSTLGSSHTSTTSHSTTSPLYLHPHNHHDWPTPFTYTDEDLPHLHANLRERLLPFFGKKALVNRKVRLSIYPERGLWDQPLSEQIVSTSATGGFKSSFSVRDGGMKRLLEDDNYESLENLRVKVVAELLEEEDVGREPTFNLETSAKIESARTVAEDEVNLKVGRDGTVRVISDIDDTIKFTEVTGGLKRMIQNVFVRDFDDILIPGMADWYQGMVAEGATIHYVSNSPNELWPVVRQYLSVGGFPSGSVTLKEYGGASSAIAKLWEEPGVRKRAGVENIIKDFPDCKFILVGDSGEQDMALYVTLAAQYPDSIIGIFIRDVSSPFSVSPPTSPPLRPNDPDSPQPLPPLQRAFTEFPDLPGAFDGSHETPLPFPFSTSVRPEPLKRPALGARAKSSFLRAATRSTPPSSPPLTETDPPLASAEARRGTTTPPILQARKEEGGVAEFFAKVAAAEKVLPKHIPLRIFRHGREVKEQGVELVVKNKG